MEVFLAMKIFGILLKENIYLWFEFLWHVQKIFLDVRFLEMEQF